jgi:hypothetical protein
LWKCLIYGIFCCSAALLLYRYGVCGAYDIC